MKSVCWAHRLDRLPAMGGISYWLVLLILPHMYAWENLGIDSRRIVMARVFKPAERLWVLEQGIKSAAFGAVIGWLSQASQQITRRLQILARAVASLIFLFRPESAQFEPSAAPLRVLLAPARHHALSVRVLKRRGLPLLRRFTSHCPRRDLFPAPPRYFRLKYFPLTYFPRFQPNAVDRSSLPGAVA